VDCVLPALSALHAALVGVELLRRVAHIPGRKPESPEPYARVNSGNALQALVPPRGAARRGRQWRPSVAATSAGDPGASQ